jgi:hypothetical protein
MNVSYSPFELLLALSLLAPFHLPQRGIFTAPTSTHVAVILVVDDSGSMGSSDPDNLRWEAARLFISLLDPGDQVGLIRFATHSQAITPGLVTLARRGAGAPWLDQSAGETSEGYTDLKAALETAADFLNNGAEPAPAIPAYVILLTDGIPEIPDPYPEYEDQLLAVASALNVPVLSIALTPAAETPILHQLALQTAGEVIHLDSAAGLLDAYLQIFGQVKRRTVLEAEGSNEGTRIEIDPALAPLVTRVDFVTGHPGGIPVEIIDPNGQSFPFPESSAGQLSIVSMAHPAGGQWQFRAERDREIWARALLDIPLYLQIDLPAPVAPAGKPLPITARLVEQPSNQGPVVVVGQASFSALVSRPDGVQERLDRFYDDGTHGDTQPGDGLFTRLYTHTDLPGTYAIRVFGWKGVLPLTAARSLTVIPWPELMIAQPDRTKYRLRDEPLRLSAYLHVDDEQLKLQGGMQAIVRKPDGSLERIDLEPDSTVFQGEFWPDADGIYQFAFQAVGMQYHGLAFTDLARTTVRLIQVPVVVVSPQALDLGMYEAAGLAAGVPFNLTLTSTGRAPAQLAVSLNDLPGLELVGERSFTLPAPGSQVVTLALAGIPVFAPGEHTGHLQLTGPADVKITQNEVPINLELFSPRINLVPEGTTWSGLEACGGEAVALHLPLTATLRSAETVQIALTGMPGWRLAAPQHVVQPDQKYLRLELQPAGRSPAGSYLGTLEIRTRPGLQLSPANRVPLAFDLPPVWNRCRSQFGRGGLVAAGMLLAGSLTYRQVRRWTDPPLVSGTLRWWPAAATEAQAQEFDLTALQSQSVLIGSGPGCSLSPPGGSLAGKHARLYAAGSVAAPVLYLEPLADVRIGFRAITIPTRLANATTYRLGDYLFRYLSDTGE